MPHDPDILLLRRFAENRDEGAFGELVGRRIDGVYSVALRRMGGDVHLAEDVTQQVFVALAHKAGRLVAHPDLTGWLYTTTHHEAANAVRTERRRKAREEKAHAMPDHSPEPQADWSRVAPVLDDAIEQLGASDRAAVLLRFIERRAFAEIGARLNVSEDAARMRVDRALEKLRSRLEDRGIASTAAALGTALGVHAATVAPASLVGVVTSAALAGAAPASGAVLLGSIFAMTKLKVAIAAGVLIGSAIALREMQASRALTAEIRQLESVRNEAASLGAARQRVVSSLAEASPSDADTQELARVRGRIALLKSRPEGVLESEMKPVSACTNQGWGTPLASFETQLWARTSGNIDAFAGAFGWMSVDGKAQVDRFFAALPEAVRARLQTPEKMLSPDKQAGALGELQSFQILGQTEYGDAVRVRAWGRFTSGRELPLDMLFKNFGGAWRVPITDQQVELWLKEFDPATGERFSKK